MQAFSALEMESLASTTSGPIAELGRIRAEWQVLDIVGGTCTTQVYLFPDEGGTGPESQPCYWCHTARLSPGDESAIILDSYVLQDSEKKDPHLRSKSIPSQLRGDARPYVPRRAISLESVGVSSISLTPGFSLSVPTSVLSNFESGNSIFNHPSELAHSTHSTAQASSLLETDISCTSALESPRTKHMSTFNTICQDSKSSLKIDTRQEPLSFFEQPRRAKKPKLPNPYINITRERDSCQFSTKYTSAPLYWVTIESQTSRSAKRSKSPEEVGPYRSAAMWEFVGQTFAKHERLKKLKRKNRRAIISELIGRTMPPSKLSQEMLADDDKKDICDIDGIRSAWTDFVNSADDLLDNFDQIPRSSPYDMDLRGWEQDDDRGRSRSCGYDPYVKEQGVSIFGFSPTSLAYDCEELSCTEGTLIPCFIPRVAKTNQRDRTKGRQWKLG